MDTAWTRVESNNDTIGCTKVVLVSTLYSRYYILALFSCSYDLFTLCIMNSFLIA